MDLISCVLHFFLRMKKLHQLSCNVVYLVCSVVWCTQNYAQTKLPCNQINVHPFAVCKQNYHVILEVRVDMKLSCCTSG